MAPTALSARQDVIEISDDEPCSTHTAPSGICRPINGTNTQKSSTIRSTGLPRTKLQAVTAAVAAGPIYLDSSDEDDFQGAPANALPDALLQSKKHRVNVHDRKGGPDNVPKSRAALDALDKHVERHSQRQARENITSEEATPQNGYNTSRPSATMMASVSSPVRTPMNVTTSASKRKRVNSALDTYGSVNTPSRSYKYDEQNMPSSAMSSQTYTLRTQTGAIPKKRKSAQVTTMQAPWDSTAVPVEQIRAEVEPELCKEQADLVEIIAQGRNVFYTGSAGCGKSTVLKAFVKRLRDQGKEVRIVTPTGRSALDIGGSTFWTFAGWTPNSMKSDLDKLRANAQGRFIAKRLQEVDVLVIDEISMIENHHFERLNEILKVARKRANEPFGGLQLVVTGDFCQLPPVKPFQFCLECGKENVRSADDKEYKCARHGVYLDIDKWAFASRAWRECKFHHCHLAQIHRQSDQTFIRILQKLRVGGGLDARDREVLLDHESETTDAVKLYPTVAEVKRVNDIELAKLTTPARVYNCLDTFSWNEEKHPHLKFKGARSHDGSLQALKEHRLDPRVEFKVGMLVVLLVNLNMENGLVNGSQGRVIGFESTSPDNLPTSISSLREKQKVKDARDVVVPPGVSALVGEYAEIREEQIKSFIQRTSVQEWPVVRFDNGRQVTVFADCRPIALGDEREYSLLMRTQIPLVSGWAMTVHKSQGMTLNRVIVDLARNFEQGMAYVALSRARSLEGLKVENLGVAMGGNEQVRAFLRDKCGIQVDE